MQTAPQQYYENQTALVTGGLGFVGRNLVDGLLKQSVEKVIVVDDCSNSSPELPKNWRGRVEHLKTSVTDEEWLDRLPEARAVFHLACKTLLECDQSPVYDMEVNALSTLRILEKIRTLRNKQISFVYTSSACVYGVTPGRPIGESYPKNPSSQYGVSKLAGENYALMYARNHGINATALRLSNVYGPGQTPDNPYCGVIGIFLDQAIKGEPLTVIGDGSQARDFTYIDDTVEAILAAGANSASKGEAFNVSSGVVVSVSDVAAGVQSTFPNAEQLSLPPRAIDDIHYRHLDNSKIGKFLGWQNTTNLIDGLAATAEWARSK